MARLSLLSSLALLLLLSSRGEGHSLSVKDVRVPPNPSLHSLPDTLQSSFDDDARYANDVTFHNFGNAPARDKWSQGDSESVAGNGWESESVAGNGWESESVAGNGRESESVAGNGWESESVAGNGRESLPDGLQYSKRGFGDYDVAGNDGYPDDVTFDDFENAPAGENESQGKPESVAGNGANTDDVTFQEYKRGFSEYDEAGKEGSTNNVTDDVNGNLPTQPDLSESYPDGLQYNKRGVAAGFPDAATLEKYDVRGFSEYDVAGNEGSTNDVTVEDTDNGPAQENWNRGGWESFPDALQYSKRGFGDYDVAGNDGYPDDVTFDDNSNHKDAANAVEESLAQRHFSPTVVQRRVKRQSWRQGLFRALNNAINNGNSNLKAQRFQALNGLMHSIHDFGATSKGGQFLKAGDYTTARADLFRFLPQNVHSFFNTHNCIEGCTGQVGDVTLTVRNGSSSSDTYDSRPTMEVRDGAKVHKIRYDDH